MSFSSEIPPIGREDRNAAPVCASAQSSKKPCACLLSRPFAEPLRLFEPIPVGFRRRRRICPRSSERNFCIGSGENFLYSIQVLKRIVDVPFLGLAPKEDIKTRGIMMKPRG
ncbi:hypothetical protein [Sutterella wadsworthensis]|uniref:hypothetical protein n=1 Tax=Sutterella wadsworthensis TaxID=40545 RepID=UPI003A958D1E